MTIARALVNDPAIVWADEPTGDLDSETAQEIVELMRRLNRERGLTFLIVTHDIAVGRATDRIVRMVDGADRRRRTTGGEVMVARVTLAEIDAVRMRMDEAVELYRESVLPALAAQPGYEGVLRARRRPRARRSCSRFWETEEAADAGLATGFYAEQVAKFATSSGRRPAARPTTSRSRGHRRR